MWAAEMWIRFRPVVSRLIFMLARRRLDEDTRVEIDAHLDSLTEDYERRVKSAASADPRFPNRGANVAVRSASSARR
jgi:hypothetical protein